MIFTEVPLPGIGMRRELTVAGERRVGDPVFIVGTRSRLRAAAAILRPMPGSGAPET
ncbi:MULTISPECIES: hypothetical protein [Cryobacterium]|uniref:hypothetical protein n=1 Tax=Cryobacterium TaxID=69578 RepID=UPI0013049A31|nr:MULTISPECIES: hypothetical protein [Cryobacterium]